MFGFFRRKFGSKPNPVQTKRVNQPVSSTTTSSKIKENDEFDSAGFAVGMLTGVPLSPTHGFSTGAMLGAVLHTDSNTDQGAGSSYDSGSSSSDSGCSSSDSGSSGGGSD
jgi:hypothetical protein